MIDHTRQDRRDKLTKMKQHSRTRQWPPPRSRALRPGGRLGLSHVTVKGPLPEELQSLLARVACVAGAGRPEQYVATLTRAGFADFTVEDQRDALLEMVNDVRRKLLGAEPAIGVGKLDLRDLDLSEAKRGTRRAVELIDGGVVGYTLVTARKHGS